MSDKRADRRRQEREDAKRKARDQAGQIIAAGQGHVWSGGGDVFEFTMSRPMPQRAPGEHQWIATVMHTMSEDAVAGARDPELLKFLDQETLLDVAIGCYTCEQPLGVIEPGSVCPGEPDA